MLPALAFAQYSAPAGDVFPTAPLIESQKAFWIRIFTEVSSKEGLFHDGEWTQPVYEKLDLRGMSLSSHRRLIGDRRKAIRDRLRRLATALEEGTPLSDGDKSFLARFPEGEATPERLRRAAYDVRFQRGLADRFRDGLIESGAYIDRMKEILESHGVPRTLAYLPHVESSFNIRSYSRAGAAGIWQFTRGTGKMFMRVGYEVDERLDPLLATEAAAEFLADNYRVLGNWPLAITAYNHGRQSLERAVRQTGKTDLAYLIRHYDGRRFKFASKNFYAEFLAAREVVQNYRQYFGELEFKPPLRYQHIELPFYLDFADAAQVAGVSRTRLAELNPSLRPPVLQGTKYIPEGYRLRLPEAMLPDAFVAAVPDELRRGQQKLTTEVVVQRGDTLYDIGRRHRVPWQRIALANNISSHRRIRPGQRLLIPTRDGAPPPAAPAAPPEPKTTVVVAPTPEGQVVGPAPAPPVQIETVAAEQQLLPDSVGFTPAEGAMLFQDLELHGYNAEMRRAEIIAAYGETLGHYADWAGVSTNAIRRINDFAGWVLKPGERIIVPFDRVSPDRFTQKRHEYHRGREEDFFSVFAVVEVVGVRVQRGDTAWSIAQSNDVPMWLFYQHNPELIGGTIHAGNVVRLPVIDELTNIEEPEAPARTRQAG